MKRILLFLGTNILVVISISILVQVLGLRPYLSKMGINYQALAVFSLLWGMIGAFISLSLSRVMAKTIYHLEMIDLSTEQDAGKIGLVKIIYRLADQAGLKVMPQVGIYPSAEINAFATGPSRNRSLVAISSQLLQEMDRAEIEAVLGHEISHIANGDMVTMTLLQGIVNAFVMFLARVVAYILLESLSRDNNRRNLNSGKSFFLYSLTVWLLEVVFMFLGSMVVASFSRYREYHADQGGARLVGKPQMIAALSYLKQIQKEQPKLAPNNMSALKISNPGKWLGLFSTHPSLDQRIKRIQELPDIGPA